jgi:hypothetical protein
MTGTSLKSPISGRRISLAIQNSQCWGLAETTAVMAGLVPAIHAGPGQRRSNSLAQKFALYVRNPRMRRRVDGRDKPGHDGERQDIPTSFAV